MNTKTLIRIMLVALVLSFFDLIIGGLFHGTVPWSNSIWILVSNLLTALIMLAVSSSFTGRGMKLATGIFLIAFGIGCFNILIEALIFHVTDLQQTLQHLVVGFFKFALLSILIAYFMATVESNGQYPESGTRSVGSWLLRIIGSSLLYLFFYFTAGIILQATLPALNEYYKGRLPGFTTLIYTQVLRGFLFTCIGIFFLRTNQLPKQRQLLLLGGIFSVLGGIAPLIPSNELMPTAIRLGHGFEVGISNFIYGWLVGLILVQPKKSEV